ncbi:branched-chain amino acid ABC transporter permease [Thiosulfatimonas sediminis]|uniref:Branched-chain amino acid ABC transporter permease n=2 Tax=Thiosulfatimonas sediminis TaxID=2675054 RepID=A0A6F8PST8_9GAMM|nr:branched-chain amino acid ABC transporter permease [Thiosulfatimonas sediminis]
MLLTQTTWAQSINDEQLRSELQQLTNAKLSTNERVITGLSDQNHPRLEAIFSAYLNDNLYYVQSTKQLIILTSNQSPYSALDAYTADALNPIDAALIKKVRSKNKIRQMLRAAISKLQLTDANPEKRLLAAQNIRSNASENERLLIENALQSETNETIQNILQETLLILKVSDDKQSKEERLSAITELSDALSNEAIQALLPLRAKNSQGEFTQDIELANAADKAIKTIEFHRDLWSHVETFFFGLSMGSVLLLVAIGLAITFGVMGVINMAHGEMIMIGAYTAFVMQQIMPGFIALSIWIAIPMAFLTAALVGILIERLVIRHLYGRPLETLLATFGISLILQQLARTIFSPLNKEVITPEFLAGSLQINDALSITYSRLYIVIFSVIIFLAVLYIMKYTSLGLQVRAVTQNRQMAKAMGINTDRIDMITFGLGSGLAGIAGVALSQLTNVGPNLGQAYIIDSFMVVVFGGVGNLWGTFIAAFALGELNKFIEPWQGAVLAKVIILVLIILFIQKKPRGLFPKKGRDAED